ETRIAAQLALPLVLKLGIRRKIRNLRRHGCESGFQNPWQTHKRSLDIEIAHLVTSRYDPVDARAASQERHHGLWAAHDHRAAVLLHDLGIADELDGIAKPLLGVEEDGFSSQGRAVPGGFADRVV